MPENTAEKARIEFTGPNAEKSGEITLPFNPSKLTFDVSPARYDGEEGEERKIRDLQAGKDGTPRPIQADPMEEMEVTMRAGLVFDTSLQKEKSVRQDVERFLAAAREPAGRDTVFCWNEIMFSGVLTEVTAKYRMFHEDGTPCRADVEFAIKSESSRDKSRLWNDQYKKLFGWG